MHIRYKLYPVTFGNDDKSYQNKSHNEITVHCAKVAYFSGLKVKCTGSILTNHLFCLNNIFLHLFIIKLHGNLPEYI